MRIVLRRICIFIGMSPAHRIRCHSCICVLCLFIVVPWVFSYPLCVCSIIHGTRAHNVSGELHGVSVGSSWHVTAHASRAHARCTYIRTYMYMSCSCMDPHNPRTGLCKPWINALHAQQAVDFCRKWVNKITKCCNSSTAGQQHTWFIVRCQTCIMSGDCKLNNPVE